MLRSLAALLLLCSLPTVAQTFSGSMSGSWWDATRPGEGQYITFETVAGRNVVYLAYFTYSAEGRATWQVGNTDYSPGATSITIPLVTGSGPRFGSEFRNADLRTDPAGSATLEFVTCTRMRMRHTAIPGTVLDLTRLVGPLAGAGCGERPPAASSLTGVVSGSWWNTTRGGEGQFITFETIGSRNVASLAYFTYNSEGAATWLVGNADIPIGARNVAIPLITGSGARFGTAFRPQDVTVTAAGSATLELLSCSALRLTYAGGQSFTHDLSRLVGPLGGLPCADTALAAAPAPNEIRSDTINSTHTQFTYSLSLYFPPGYVPGSANHPVIYAADAEVTFNPLVDALRSGNYNAVVIGIGFGTEARRFLDYDFGGGEAYYRFLSRELMPHVETKYRIDRTRRTYLGFSMSGLHTAITMFLEDPSDRRFSSFLSLDAPYHRSAPRLNDIEQAYFQANQDLPVKIFMGGAEYAAPVSTFHQRLQSRSYRGLRSENKTYDLGHFQMIDPATREGLAYLFRAD